MRALPAWRELSKIKLRSWRTSSRSGGAPAPEAHSRLTPTDRRPVRRARHARRGLRGVPAAPGPASSIPAARPISTAPYQVGAYYFPGWRTLDRWKVLDAFPERTPLLGYYREGDPSVMDWQIKWAVEHGISFFAFDWYWDRGRRKLEHALHDGYFRERLRPYMKFCLLWANHNPPGSSSEADLLAMTDYWIANYFRQPDYLTIEGKPVVIVFIPRELRRDMGTNAVRTAFARMRERTRAAGLPGIYIMGAARENTRLETLVHEGYDAGTGYNYPRAGMPDDTALSAPYSAMVDGYEQIWYSIAVQRLIDYAPVTEPGWDSRPWHGDKALVRTGRDPRVRGHAEAGAGLHRSVSDRRRPEAGSDRGLERARRGRGDRAASPVGIRLPRRRPARILPGAWAAPGPDSGRSRHRRSSRALKSGRAGGEIAWREQGWASSGARRHRSARCRPRGGRLRRRSRHRAHRIVQPCRWAHAGWLLAAWATALAAAGLLIARLRVFRQSRPPSGWPPLPRGLDLAMMVWIATVVALTGALALSAVPINPDSMTYHLARVAHWAQSRSVAFYPTHIIRQLYQPPWAEFAALHLFIFAGGDRLVNLVQWISMAASLVGVSAIARQLGAGGADSS